MTRRSSPQVEYVTVHGHRRAYVKRRIGAGRPPAPRPRLRPHDLGAGHRLARPALHRDRARPARPRVVRQAARRLQRRRLRQRDARPADLLGHRHGDGGRAQLRRREWRCSSPTSSPSGPSGSCWSAPGASVPRSTPRSASITTPGFQQVMGVLDAAGRSPRRPRRPCAVLARTGISQLRDLDEVAAIYDSFKDPSARAAIRHVVRAVVDWKGQIVTMADRAYLTEAMPMCVIWGARRPGHPGQPREQRQRRSRRPPASRSSPTPATSRTRTTRSASPRSCSDFIRSTTEPAPLRTARAGATCSRTGGVARPPAERHGPARRRV